MNNTATSRASRATRPFPFLRPLPLVAALSAVFVLPVHAQANFSVDAGVTDNGNKILAGHTGSVAAGGTLSVGSGIAVRVNAGTSVINNAGTIAQTGAGRAIDANTGTPLLTLNNLAGGLITSVGEDTIRLGSASGSYLLNNQGTIWQMGVDAGGFRAIKVDAAFSNAGAAHIVNGSASNGAAVIRSNGNDALRLGSNATLTNYGSIFSTGVVNTSCPGYLDDQDLCGADLSAADGVAIENGRANTVILNHGSITGPRHGVDGGDPVNALASEPLRTADRISVRSIAANGEVLFDVTRNGVTEEGVKLTNPTVINYAGATITGKNGSGVGIDGHAVVINHGTITGDYAGAGQVYDHEGLGMTTSNGDGDGVDIDGIAYVENYGRIQGLGAGGLDSGGHPNGADGIAAGGGTLINHAGAVIFGQSKGILVDDGANGTATASGRGTDTATGGVVTILNDGSITGERGTAIGLVGDFADRLVNGATGVITGGAASYQVDVEGSTTPAAAVQMGAGADTLTNYGRIEGRNGLAIDMGAGDDVTRLFAGGSTGVVVGTVDGGAGIDTLETGGVQRFAAGSVIHFERFIVRDGSTTFLYALGPVSSVQVDAGAALRIDGSFSTSGDLTVDGQLQAASGDTLRTVQVGGNYTQGATGVLQARLGAGNTSDRIVVAGTATLADGATLHAQPTRYVTDGAVYTLISATGALTATAANLQLVNDSALVRYSLSGTGHELQLTAERTGTLAGVAPAGLGGIGAALDALGQGGSSLDALLGRIDAQSSVQGVADALRELAPNGNRAGQQATQVTASAVFSALGDRMDLARNGDNGSADTLAQGAVRGLSAGEGLAGRGWVQGLGAWGEQKARDGVAGYDIDAHGLAFGLESDRSANEVMGLSFGLNRASADGQGTGLGDDVRVKAASLGGYLSRDLGGMTLDVSALLSHNRYDSRRAIAVGGVTEIATGDYKGWQIGGQVEAGFPFMLSPDVSGRWLVGGRASYLSTGSYDEQGSSAALRMGSAHARSLQSVLGAELTRALSPASSVQLRARWLHEFADTPDLNAAFVAGGPGFTTAGAQPGRDALQLGVGWRHQAARGMTLSLRYDAEIKRAYLAHQLSARATWSF